MLCQESKVVWTTSTLKTNEAASCNNCILSSLNWTVFELAATVPELLCGESAVQEPAQILNFLRKQVRVDSSLSVRHLIYGSLLSIFDLSCLSSWFQRFNADYELTARQGADTMAYIALLEEKLRPALVEPSLVCMRQESPLCRFLQWLHSDRISPTAAHFLGGCWKLCQLDAAVVCLPLAVPAELCRACPTRQHCPLPNPPDQGRGAAP